MKLHVFRLSTRAPSPLFALVISLRVAHIGAPEAHASALADTAWTGGGLLVAPSDGAQQLVTAIPDGTGGIYIAWEEVRLGRAAIFAQRLSAAGTRAPGWPLEGARVCTTSRAAGLPPGLVHDGAGGAIISWLDDRAGAPSLRDVFAQRLSPDGTLQWGPDGVAVTSTTTAYSCFSSAADGLGGAIFAWQDQRYGYLHDHVFTQRMNAGGQRLWSTSGVSTNADTSVGHLQWCPKVISDGAGGAICAWTDIRYGNDRRAIFAQRINAGGTAQWADSGLAVDLELCPTINCGELRRVVPDGLGGAILTSSTKSAHRVSGAGTQLWGELGITLPLQPWAILPDGVGGMFATFHSAASHVILAEHYSAAGTPQWGTPTLSSGTTAQVSGSERMTSDGASGFLFAWEDRRGGPGTGPPSTFADIYAQRMTSAGSVAPGWPATARAICTRDSLQQHPTMVSDGAGGAIVAWIDFRSGVGAIHAARAMSDGLVSTRLTLVSAQVVDGSVQLMWSSQHSPGASFTLYRSGSGEDWRALSEVMVGGSGVMSFVDRKVTAGEVYRYRLAHLEAGRQVFSGQAMVEVPARLRFGIESPRPNPSASGMVVAFTLDSSEPASLELIDAAGRVVVAEANLNLGPGRHVHNLWKADRLRPGFYVLRLQQMERLVTTSAIIVR